MATRYSPIIMVEPPTVAVAKEETQEEVSDKGQYKATELWQKIVEQFRKGMPVGKHRLRMKIYDKTFTGSEAIEWLISYLQSSGMFQTICKGQVVTLLQKFLESDVIEDARGKESVKFIADGSHLYQFVTKPGPLNFLPEHCTPVKAVPPAATHDHSNDHSNDETVHQFESECNKIWKDLTLARLLSILPSLETVPTVDGTIVAKNVKRGHTFNEDDDIPSWVIMAFKCLSKWPDDTCDDVTGGLPIYHGFEHDVFQSVSNYFTRQPHPLIPYHLYDLFMSIHPLIASNRHKTATEALQLSSLLIETCQRIKLHRLLRFVNKTGKNSQLQLSLRVTNKDFMLERFSLSIMRSKSVPESRDQRNMISQIINHMVEHYHDIFKVPNDLIQEIEYHFRHISPHDVPQYCQRVSKAVYEEQKSTSRDHLVQLLESIIHDENMSNKVKKNRLKQFKQSYPDIYLQHYPVRQTSLTRQATHHTNEQQRISNYF